jgi:hypothetical protein
MSTADIKQQLHYYIDNADEEKVEAIYTLLKNDISSFSMLSDEHKTELDTRLGEYLEAKGTSYSWSQALKIIRSK